MISSVTSSSDSSTSVTNSAAYAMDTGDFLKLLLTELENQDPMDPVSTSDMASQFASLTQVSQMAKVVDSIENMNDTVANVMDSIENMSNNQSIEYLGKTISYSKENSDGTSETITSKVTGIEYTDGVAYLITEDGGKVGLSSVLGVSS